MEKIRHIKQQSFNNNMGDKSKLKTRAIERIHILFSKAANAPQTTANRAVKLARTIQMKFKVRMPAAFRYRFCKYCLAYWNSKTVRIRTRMGKVVFLCRACKHIRRKPYR
jgi:RNase P subunit RPR2